MSATLFDEKVFEDADIAPAMRMVSQDDSGDVTGFGVCVPRAPQEATGAIKLIAVDAKVRRLGIGATLAAHLERVLTFRGCRAVRLGESPPNYLQPGIDQDAVDAIGFFESRGYRSFSTVHDMRCELYEADLSTTDDESRLAGRGVVVRRATAADMASLTRAVREYWGGWLPEVRIAMSHDPPAVHVAAVASEVVAFSAHSSNNQSIGWFGPMGTVPESRGIGVGTVLLRRCLRDLRDYGFAQAVIPWVGPVTFYERAVGARVERTYLRFEKTL